ncbi:MAG TPA: LysM peptidoglycan-binding domain-containing protein [Nitrococcus sp.]|nr:LysM peptidoglycan-binding domain-containing protein [Nitrococcus sp.]
MRSVELQPLTDSSSQDAISFATLPLAAPTDDLWTRIRRGFKLPKASNQPLVQRKINYFANHQAYLGRAAERAQPYLFYIVQALEQRGMPTEIALLPIVESAFRPFAYSAGQAAGIWQFIPATAQDYGLKQNWWYDGRRDVIAATHAALDYLQRLNEIFAGDWLLTIAAYNAGEGTVLRAIKHNADRGRPTDFWHLDLPAETESYVPQLLALCNLINTPAKYGLKLPPIPNEIPIAVVKISSQIDLALAARLADISVAKIYQLNPGYNRWATGPKGPHRLVLPVDRVAQFKEGLAAIPPEKRVHWRRHRVARGDTLNEIARHYHTTPAVLKTINGLQSNVIHTGNHLIIPLTSHLAAVAALSPNQHGTASVKTTYIVQPGDSLWGIARAHQNTVARLCRWNQIAPDAALHAGQKLTLWQARPTGSVDLASLQSSMRIQSIRYTVQPGDSLYQIAQRFNVTVSDLRRWNNLPKGQSLQPGQRLQLRVDVTRVSDNS